MPLSPLPDIEHDIGGFRLAIREGRKKPGDRRLEMQNREGRWIPVPMSLVGYMTAFFYDNEEHLYPKAHGFDGGDYFMEYLTECSTLGHMKATDRLEKEKLARRRATAT